MRTHCTDQRDLEGDRARSGPRGCCRGIARPAIWARFRRSLVPLTAWDVAIQSRRSGAGSSAEEPVVVGARRIIRGEPRVSEEALRCRGVSGAIQPEGWRG